jgi:hypothetical protein
VQGVDEQSSTRAKLEAGFWVTLRDLPELNRQPAPPRGLLLHLDLLLTALLFGKTQDALSLSEAEHALNALFAQPALHHYGRCAACTVQAPIEEVQARWRRRYPQGLDPSADPLLARKDRLITDPRHAASVFGVLHRAWNNHLLRLERSGRLLCNREARLSLGGPANIPVTPSALPAFPRSK